MAGVSHPGRQQWNKCLGLMSQGGSSSAPGASAPGMDTLKGALLKEIAGLCHKFAADLASARTAEPVGGTGPKPLDACECLV